MPRRMRCTEERPGAAHANFLYLGPIIPRITYQGFWTKFGRSNRNLNGNDRLSTTSPRSIWDAGVVLYVLMRRTASASLRSLFPLDSKYIPLHPCPDGHRPFWYSHLRSAELRWAGKAITFFFFLRWILFFLEFREAAKEPRPANLRKNLGTSSLRPEVLYARLPQRIGASGGR